MSQTRRTQVGIIGAGPAGLLLARWLQREGVDCVVFEAKSRDYVLARVRAGVLERGTADTLRALDAAAGMDAVGREMTEAVVHLNGTRYAVPYEPYTGKTMVSYGQQSVVRDLIDLNEAAGVPVLFETPVEAIEGIDGSAPVLRATGPEGPLEIACDYVAACDGFWGIGRKTMPGAEAASHELDYGFGWLGILAEVEPDMDLLGFAAHTRGFALGSLRPPGFSRHYIQVPGGDRAENWSDEEVWDELDLRLGRKPGEGMPRGPVVQKNIAWLRSFVCEKMQHGRLFLAGDAAHIVPPTGAKGLNLAVGDVRVLATGLVAAARGDGALLDRYAEIALRRIWQTMRFSWAMTRAFHRPASETSFEARMREETIARWVTHEAGRADLAYGMVGVPFEV